MTYLNISSKFISLTSILFIFPLCSTNAQVGNSALTIEPVVGYERVQKLEPTPHTNERLIYGLRANYGVSLLSAEAEVTRGKDTEDFPLQDLTIEETATNVMLGLRSNIYYGQIFSWYLRAGGHARKREITRTEDGVTTEEEPAVYVSPYAGTGLTMRYSNMLSLNAGLTVIFTGRPKGDDREYQPTLGFSVDI